MTNIIPRNILLAIRVCDRYKFPDKEFYYTIKKHLLKKIGHPQGYALQHLYKYKVEGKRRPKYVSTTAIPDEISNSGVGGWSYVSEHRHLLYRYILKTQHPRKHKPEYHLLYDISPEYKYRAGDFTHMSNNYVEAIKDIREFGVPKSPNRFSKSFNVTEMFHRVMWFSFNTVSLPNEVRAKIKEYAYIQQQTRIKKLWEESLKPNTILKERENPATRTKQVNYDVSY